MSNDQYNVMLTAVPVGMLAAIASAFLVGGLTNSLRFGAAAAGAMALTVLFVAAKKCGVFR